MRIRFPHSPHVQKYLCLDGVGSLEHVINLLQVVGTWNDGRGITSGLEVLLQVGLLAQIAHLENGQHQTNA